MTNTIEMPKKIWAFNYNDEHDWNIKAVEGATSYTRTDTIPSKAEVAREFQATIDAKVDAFVQSMQQSGLLPQGNNAHYVLGHQYLQVRDEAEEEVLKEWEEADDK